MKRAIFCILSIIIAFSVIACEKIVLKTLPAPKVVVEQGWVKWEYVMNASAYEIVTDKTIKTTNTIFYYSDYKGEIKIRCLGDGKLYANSDYTVVDV